MTFLHGSRLVVGAALIALGAGAVVPMDAAALHRFDFGATASEAVAEGWVAVDGAAIFSRERGFGFEPGVAVHAIDRGGGDRVRRDFVTADEPFYFSVVVPREGNYRVTVILGDAAGESTTTVKAELRRLMLEQVATRPGGFRVQRFLVNTRTPRIDDTRSVRLKERERTSEAWAWDDRITLEFNGPRPALCALEIEPADEVPTLYLLGDSTMTDQAREPYAGWGQMLTRFLKDDIAVANHGESGESYASAFGEGRVDKVASLLRPGDFVALQFGHNDQKAKGEGRGAFLDYTDDIRRAVALIRARKAVPILVTSMQRREFDGAGRVVETLGDYPEAVRRAAAELRVALIDLHSMSTTLLQAFGPEGSAVLFKDGDSTHHSAFGAYEHAKCVLIGLRSARLPFAGSIADEFESFDPAHPDHPGCGMGLLQSVLT
ncbi:MAG: rhamnogalacturonan acetylesterase, partial [Opitutaceae bacterium]|nr:rhamnogalacturonan acetylesterase [Opitutaceae bacterium]